MPKPSIETIALTQMKLSAQSELTGKTMAYLKPVFTRDDILKDKIVAIISQTGHLLLVIMFTSQSH